MDRECLLPERGDIDAEKGEFWSENPFMMLTSGDNLSAYEHNRMFLNQNGRRFLDVSSFSGCDIDSDSRSVIAADFDRDGRVDVLVGSVGGGPLRLFLNRLESDGNHRVRIELNGTTSNRPAIGSRVTLKCGDRTITRDVFAHNPCMGQSPPELLVGVGAVQRIDEFSVNWPDGTNQSFTDLPVDVVLQITQGDDAVGSRAFKNAASAADIPDAAPVRPADP